MLNYAIDAAILSPYVPMGTELDSFEGVTYVSMVGFLFLDTRVVGVPIPLHRDFEEVNLRFYVRRKAEEGWRRGVVFVKEIVPKRAIAAVARWLYHENYVSMPMRHAIEPSRVVYGWRPGDWNHLEVMPAGEPSMPDAGSAGEFITEHYWGYTRGRGGRTTEYKVEHPPWRVWQTSSARLHCDAATLYGPEFAEALAGRPQSAFLAEGSPVTVYRGVRL